MLCKFGDAGNSRKLACLERSEKAGFTVYEQLENEPDDKWRSVVMKGTLQEIKENSMEAFIALASNAEFAPDMAVWGASLDETELTRYELNIEESTGRAFSMAV